MNNVDCMSYQTIDPESANEAKTVDDINSSSKNFSAMHYASLFALIFVSVALYSSNAIGNFQPKTMLSATDYDTSFVIAASSVDYGTLKSASYLPWDLIVEPYRDHVLEMTSLVVNGENVTDSISTDYTITWTIDGEAFEGSPVTVNLETVGVLSGEVSVSYQGAVVSTQTISVAVKYVRREIRTLTTSDKTKWVSALRQLYDLSMEEGQSTYGEDFVNAEWFAYSHLNGAGRTDCDHWHDGAAIATTHLSFTLLAERALQSIDPSISMPYWEYGTDYLLYDDWADSAVFADDLLGAASSSQSDHAMTTGTWANISVPSGADYLDWDIATEGSLNPFVNAYGMLRSPWNNNPTSTISRYRQVYGSETTVMPQCDLISACYNSHKLSSMNDCLNGVTHGPVHILIGGCWGEDEAIIENKNTNFLLGIDKLLFFKMLWRMGLTRCPTSCDVNSDDACVCAVPDTYIEQYGAQGILEMAGIYDIAISNLEGRSDDVMLAVLRAIEDPGIVGEMFSSMASYDPSFWPLHGQLDRILSLKRIELAKGNVKFDESWGWGSANNRYTQGVCDWSNVTSPDDLTLPVCNMTTTNICSGHNEDDESPFADRFASEGVTTNAEMYTFLHPWNDNLTYTYDTFDFDYCEDEGYTFA